jgi:hypothetical protein
VPPVAFSVAL